MLGLYEKEKVFEHLVFLLDLTDKKWGKGKDKIDDEDITFQRMVAKVSESALLLFSSLLIFKKKVFFSVFFAGNLCLLSTIMMIMIPSTLGILREFVFQL